MKKADNSVTWNFTYNADGLRTKRTNGTKTYEYIYNGSQLTQMTVDGKTLTFSYDASGTPLSVNYNGTTYYYVTNIQGDITAILNSSGTEVVSYTYDTWGNPLATTGSLADDIGTYNPLRYRGYVYDQETGFYYLQSRYYNPEIGRFLNADNVAFLGVDGTLLSYNLFSYCKNTPVFSKDSSGNFCVVAAVAAITITGAIVGGLMGAFTAATTGGNVLESTIEGCLTGTVGALCGLLISNPAVAIGAAFAGGFAIDVAVQCVSNKSIDLNEVDYSRSIKTGDLTGIGVMIPQFGNPLISATDAFATALIWSEGSALIAAADVVTTKVNSQNPSRTEILENAVQSITAGQNSPIINRYATPWAIYYT